MRNPPYFLNRNYSGRFASTKVLPTFLLFVGITVFFWAGVCGVFLG